MTVTATDPLFTEREKRKGVEMDWPAQSALAVTPSDTDDLASICRGLWVGTGGDVKVLVGDDATAVTFANVADGTLIPIRTRRVYSTGTTASDIVALY
jgi:hypothetical protein